MPDRIEIAYDWATQRGGGERLAATMVRLLGGVPLHLGLYEPSATFPEFADLDVRPLPINRLGVLRRNQRLALPVMAPAFSALRIDADVALLASAGFAHGARCTGRKVVYCYTPARWLYQTERYVREAGPAARAAIAALGGPLRRWDARAAATADDYLCLSTAVRDRIREVYDRDATVLHAPHSIDPDGEATPIEGVPDGFVLCIARLLPYKNVDAVIDAVAMLDDVHLVVVGAGPDRERLAARAGPSVTMLQGISDAELRWLYARCEAVVAASHEDYGLTPVEGAAFGKPSAVLRWGGFLDTVLEGRTGTFFDEPEPGAVRDGIREVLDRSWDPTVIRAHADELSEDVFAARLRDLVGARPGDGAAGTIPSPDQ